MTTTNTIVRRRWVNAVGGLLLAYGGIANVVLAAEQETSPLQQVVRIGDLNLRDTHGVAAAYNRILWAAQRVCPSTDSSDFWVRLSAMPCVTQAVSRAVDNIGSPQLSEYVQSQPLFR
jgi:UrcA family protein